MKMEIRMSSRGVKSVRKRYADWRRKTMESKIYIATLFALCRGKCPICDVDMILSFNDVDNQQPFCATLDHTDPLSEILEHRKYGLQIMCKACNEKKGNTKTPQDS